MPSPALRITPFAVFTFLLPLLPGQVPIVTPSPYEPDPRLMTCNVTTEAAVGQVMLVGYLSIENNPVAIRLYGSTMPAIQYASSTPQQMLNAIGGLATGTVPIATGSFELPADLLPATLQPFATACASLGFAGAALAIAQQASGHQLHWQALSSGGTPTSLIAWSETWAGEPQPRTLLQQEALARRLLVHQFARVGKPGLTPASPDIDFVMMLASSVPLNLHLLPLEVEAATPTTAPPHVRVGRSFSIPFSPTSQADGFYFRFVDPTGEYYVYPAMPEVTLEIQLAEPIANQTLLANLQIVFAGGGLATNVAGAVGSDRLTCTIPASATSGLFLVADVSTNQPIGLAGPSGPQLAALLQRVYMD